MNIIKIIIRIGFLLTMNTPILSAQQDALESPLPLDPSIRHGQLANGFTYFIKNIENSSEKINMHLYVKTGTWHQQQNQMDFAHALEHLAFKCAPNFPINLLNNPELLARLGMEKGDIFAHTRSMYTSYNFDIPKHNLNAMDMGLLWFRDISDLQLTTDKINSERGPLRQEVTFKQGSNIQKWFVKTRMESRLFPFKLDWSNFFDHNSNFQPSSLRAFYKHWYHPDRMGLVIVGEISDIDLVESKIKSQFSDLKGRSKPWMDTHIQYLKGPDQLIVEEQNSDTQDTDDIIFYLHLRDNKILDKQNRSTWKGLQRQVVWAMLNKLSLLNSRFKEATNSYNTSTTAFGHSEIQVLPIYTVRITANSRDGKEAFEKFIRILYQIKEQGFTQNEWENAKMEQLTDLKSMDVTRSKYWVDQIRDYYVYETALPKGKVKKLEQWLSRLSLEDFNSLIGQYFSEICNDIGIIVPHGQKSMYSETKVRGWLENVLDEVPQPYTAPEIPRQLLSAFEISALKEVGYHELIKTSSLPVLKNGRVLKRVKLQGVREFVLNNGIKIVLDNSDSRNNKVYIHGFSSKGASSFPKTNYFSAINAPLIIKNAGVGEMDKFELDRFLDSTSLWQGVFPYINDNETGIKGSANIKDLEKLLQLIYLYITEPREDQEAFEDWKLMEKNRYLNARSNTITSDYNAAMANFIGDNSEVLKGVRRLRGVSKTNMARAYKIYKQLFTNPGDFTFIVSGNYSESEVLPLVQKYLGNLPDLSDKEACFPYKIREKSSIEGPLYQEFSPKSIGAFYNMKSVMYSLRFIAPAHNLVDWKEQIKVEVLGFLMNSKVQELRYIDGFTLYNMRAFGGLNKNLSSYDIEIRLDIIPKELEALRKASKEMILEIKNRSFTEARFDQVIQNTALSIYKSRKQSTFHRLQQLHDYYVYKQPWVTLSESDIAHYIRSLTLEDVRETAQKYLNEDYLIEFVMQNNNVNEHP